MRILLSLALACLWPVVSSRPLGAQSPAATTPVVEWSDAERAARPWLGREVEYEEYLRTARVVREEKTEIGVTEPSHVFFEEGGLAEGALVKPLQTSRKSGYLESYLSEIAAYELDKLLQLGMVPPTVERTYNGRKASAQLWVNDTSFLHELQEAGERSPNILSWQRQVRRWRVFHNLIANIDANQGNLLILKNPDWHLFLVDHSRAFGGRREMIFDMSAIDRGFYERLKALDEPTLEEALGHWIISGERSILRRRDDIVKHFEELIAEKGEPAVIAP